MFFGIHNLKKNLLWVFLIASLLLLGLPARAIAFFDPLSQPNNKVGIHLLSPEEIVPTAKIVNGNSGDWGYVTVPIQSVDRSQTKWQKFMDQARSLHVIPIIRLATYVKGSQWVMPTEDDVLDFANFLNTLSWPTQNRYVVIFNEPNHADEWGGHVSPEEYESILEFAVQAFKDKSQDFFVLPAGLDAAAPNSQNLLSSKVFLTRMARVNRNVFSQIDGWTSHSYPNPDFSALPTSRNFASTSGFIYELQIIAKWTTKKLPVFITETGWQHRDIAPQTVANFLNTAFSVIWSDPRVVAVTPFILSADEGPFEKFSFLKKGESTPQSEALKNLPKIKGSPLEALPSTTKPVEEPANPSIIQEPVGPLLNLFRSWLKF